MIKRTSALILALAVLTLSFTGCANKPSVIASYDGGEIPAGVYILNEFNQYTSFSNYTGISNLSTKVTPDQTLEEVVTEDAKNAVRGFAAAEAECRRLGVELPKEDLEKIALEAENEYKASKELYESKGIGLESLKMTKVNNALSYMLLGKLYGEGGEMEVTTDEKEIYLKDKYRKAVVIDIPYKDSEGKNLEGDEKAAKEKEAEELFNSIENGSKKFMDAFREVYEAKGAVVVKDADEKKYSTLISAADTRFVPAFTSMLFEKEPELNKVSLYKYEGGSYIYVLRDVLEDNLAENAGDQILYDMKGKDFSDYLLLKSQEIGLTFDESALKAYSVKNIVNR